LDIFFGVNGLETNGFQSFTFDRQPLIIIGADHKGAKTDRAMNKPERKMLSDSAVEMIASRFKVLSDGTRLRLLHALFEGKMNIGQLVEATQVNQANVSKHMATLLEANMVARHREGTHVYYHISDKSIFDLCDLMCNKLRKDFEECAAQFSKTTLDPEPTRKIKQ